MGKVEDRLEQILKDSEVAKFLQSHQGAAEEIRDAAMELAGSEDDIVAVRKLLDALGRKVLPIFFSYKTKEQKAAKKIVELLRKNSAEKLEISYQGDFPKDLPGKEWRKEIRSAIKHANWFILLLPDPSDDWDWCLFETGLFEAQQTSGDRLICIHHPKVKVPDQINAYQAVAAKPDEVKDFLRMVYIDKSPIPGMKPINKAIQDDIGALAQQIIDAILPPREEHFHQIFEPWISLKVPKAAELKSKDDLDEADIEGINRAALDLFEFIDQPNSWGELWPGLPEQDDYGRWRNELFHVIRRVGGGRKYVPIQAVFQTATGKLYRPILHGVDRVGGEHGPIDNYHITFTEEIGAVDTSGMPENVSELGTMLRFAFRFRWEVLEKFTKGAMTEDDVERVDNALRRLETEWESRGIGGPAEIEGMLPEGKARDRVSKMLQDTASLRKPDGTGELDVAIEQKDAKEVQQILKRIMPINQEFLEIVTDAFSEIIHKA